MNQPTPLPRRERSPHARIIDLPAADRPREKLAAQGAAALSDAELLALLLGTGDRRRSAVELGEALLVALSERRSQPDASPDPGRPVSPLVALLQTSRDEMATVAGLGPAKAARLLATAELARRTGANLAPLPATIETPQAAYTCLAPRLRGLVTEHAWVIVLDRRHGLLAIDLIGIGVLDQVLIHPRETFRPAVQRNAAAIILAHNHPSGSLSPSASDLAVTKRLLAASDVLGISLLDHLVVTENGFASIREQSALWLGRPPFSVLAVQCA